MYGFGAEGAAGALVAELATVVAGVSLLIWGGGGLAGGSLALIMTKIIVFENVRKFSKKGLFFTTLVDVWVGLPQKREYGVREDLAD